MNDQGNPLVWFILIFAFLAVGIHLFIYSKKRRSMLKGFSQSRGLHYTPDDHGRLETELNRKLALDESGLVRSFMKIKDIVSDGEISLFRCIELLDLNPYGTVASPHQNHICVSLEVPVVINLFFITNKEGHTNNIYPKDKNLFEDTFFLQLQPLIEQNLPKESVTISFRRGRAIIYLNPLVVGGEKEEDLDYLLSLGKAIKHTLPK